MANLIHENAVESATKIMTETKDWRIASKGTPITKNDTLIVSWEMRHTAAWAMQDADYKVTVLNPENLQWNPLVNGVTHRKENGTVKLQSIRKEILDEGCKLYYTLPPSWKGLVYLTQTNLRAIKNACDKGQIQEDLMLVNYCTPASCSDYVKTSMLRNKRYYERLFEPLDVNDMYYSKSLEERNFLVKEKTLPLERGSIKFNLLECLNWLPEERSIQATVGGFPYSFVPRNYLIWLVSNGELPGGKLMETATEYKGNSLRSSILYYLEKTKTYERFDGELVDKERVTRQGNWENSNPPDWAKVVNNQKTKIDFDPKDFEYRFFSTFSHMEGDKLIVSGTSGPSRWEAHGPAVWIETKKKRGNEFDTSLTHVNTGLTEFERTEKWMSCETENYDWIPATFSRLDILKRKAVFDAMPKGKKYIEGITKLFNLHNRLDIWLERKDYLDNQKALSRSESDTEKLNWEFKELNTEIDRITEEYTGVFYILGGDIPKPWGLMDRITKAKETKEEEPAVQEPEECTEVYEIKSVKVKKKKKPISWEELEQLEVSKHSKTSYAIQFAKTQNPNLKPKRGLLV